VQVDIEASAIGRRYEAIPIVADARVALAGLLDAFGDGGAGVSDRARARTEVVRELRATSWGALRRDPRTAPAVTFIDEMHAALPMDAVVVADMCVAGYWCAGYLPVVRSRRLLFPTWGTLGFALPASIGAAIGVKGPVVAVVGDAGFAFFVGELATAVEQGINLIVLVVNDLGYGMLRYDESVRYGRTFATDLFFPELESLAGAFGIPYLRADLDGGLHRAVREAVAEEGPYVIELPVALFPPPTTSPRWPTRGGAPQV
jgi:acetolactate synthase-1/2/3 large subunit